MLQSTFPGHSMGTMYPLFKVCLQRKKNVLNSVLLLWELMASITKHLLGICLKELCLCEHNKVQRRFLKTHLPSPGWWERQCWSLGTILHVSSHRGSHAVILHWNQICAQSFEC